MPGRWKRRGRGTDLGTAVACCGNRALGLTVPGNAIKLVSLLRRAGFH